MTAVAAALAGLAPDRIAGAGAKSLESAIELAAQAGEDARTLVRGTLEIQQSLYSLTVAYLKVERIVVMERAYLVGKLRKEEASLRSSGHADHNSLAEKAQQMRVSLGVDAMAAAGPDGAIQRLQRANRLVDSFNRVRCLKVVASEVANHLASQLLGRGELGEARRFSPQLATGAEAARGGGAERRHRALRCRGLLQQGQIEITKAFTNLATSTQRSTTLRFQKTTTSTSNYPYIRPSTGCSNRCLLTHTRGAVH